MRQNWGSLPWVSFMVSYVCLSQSIRLWGFMELRKKNHQNHLWTPRRMWWWSLMTRIGPWVLEGQCFQKKIKKQWRTFSFWKLQKVICAIGWWKDPVGHDGWSTRRVVRCSFACCYWSKENLSQPRGVKNNEANEFAEKPLDLYNCSSWSPMIQHCSLSICVNLETVWTPLLELL